MIADTTPRTTQNCNGVLESFSFVFPILVSSDLYVFIRHKTTGVITELTETTDYAVTDPNGRSGVRADYSVGGTITTTVIPPYTSAYQITIERLAPYTQAADFSEGMQGLYQQFEICLDKLTMLIQQARDATARSLHTPSDDSTSTELPTLAERANHLLGFDDDGEPIASDYDGPIIETVEFDGDDMVFTRSDDSTITLADAKTDLKGEQGDPGVDAAEIESVAWSGDDMEFTKDDATTFSLTDAKVDLKGEQGVQGEQGEQGPAGDVDVIETQVFI